MSGSNGSGGTPNNERRWQFGWCTYVETSRQLFVHGEPVRIEGKPADVLVQLLERPTTALTKDELIGAAWSNTASGASDQSLTTAIRKLRLAFGGNRDDIIVNVSGIGYRMAVPVTESLVSEPAQPVFKLAAGDSIPGRSHWKAVRPLGPGQPEMVWLAEHSKTRETRVFKFAMDGVRLRALQREVTLSRLLHKSLTDTSAFVRVVDWELEEQPFLTESEFGGLNLLEWSATEDFQRLPFAGRVALATGLAEAVASAHTLGILHNDLKPSNVLIAAHTEAGAWQVKVVDFGVASLSEPERLRQMEITEHGFAGEAGERQSSPGGTAMYRAPEIMTAAASGTAASASVLADVYALGVMLYQIVCGDFQEPPSPGWERRIEDALLREDIAEAANIDPSARISSAAALAERLRTLDARRAERNARDRALAAAQHAAQALSQARMRRPWVIFAIVALCAGLGASLWSERRATKARDAARADAAHARRLEAFTEGLFTAGDEGAAEKGLTVEALLERGVKAARAFNTDRPEQAEMLHTLGKVYDDLGLFNTAESLFLAALKEREQLFGANSPEAASTLVELSALRSDQGRYPEALSLAQRAYASYAHALPKDDPQTLRTQTKIGGAWIDLGDYAKAVPLLEAVAQKERGKPDLVADLSEATNGLGMAETYLGHTAEALRFNEESLAIDRQRLGDRHPNIGASLVTRAQLELMNGDIAKSEIDAREALNIYSAWLKPGHFEIAGAETTLSDALVRQGKAAEALPLLTDALQTQQALYPNANERTAHTLAALGATERALQHPDEALAYYQRAAAQYLTLFPGKDYRFGIMLYREGEIYLDEAKLPQAEKSLREAVEIAAARLPASDERLLDARLLLGRTLVAEHRPAEAQSLFADTYKVASAGGASLKHEHDLAGDALKNLPAASKIPPAPPG